MSQQARSDQSNIPFILSGQSLVRDGRTIAQDAGRTLPLAVFTVMGRKAVSIPTTGTAATGNTSGSGAMTAVAGIFGRIPRPGAWVVECTAAVANGGVFKITDPSGVIVATGLTLTPGSTNTTIIRVPDAGLVFSITDATDFAPGDKFTITVTAVDKWAPFLPGNIDGAQVPRAILMSDTITAAALVAGDITSQALLVGGSCTVDSSMIVFDDGVTTLDTVLTGGMTVRDALVHVGIFAEDIVDIDAFEN